MNVNEAAGRLSQGEIARRALKALAERRMIPTPDTFADVYFEMAGQRPGAGTAVAVIKDLLRDLMRQNRLSSQEAGALMESATRHDWPAVRDALDKVLVRRNGAAGGNWPAMALNLLKQADALHANWTRGRKLDAVSRVIDGAGGDPQIALDRLQRLVESWGPAMATLPKPPLREEERDPLTAHTQPLPPDFPGLMPAAQRYAADPEELERLKAQLASAQAQAEGWKQVALRAARVIEHGCAEGSPAQLKLREYVQQHARPLPDTELDKLVPRFVDVIAAIDREQAEEHKVKAGLQRLLALLCDNMKTLSPEEAWLAGQLEPIRALLSGPMQSQQLAEAEARLNQVISQQAGARRSLQEAKLALKEMLATLIERIGTMGSSTGRFYDQVGAYQAELEKATDFETLSRVIQGLLADTQIVRADIQQSREDLMNARRKVEAYEQRVKQLERELMTVSTLVQKDPLTHALNRRGLEEAFRIETARAQRYGTPLSLAIVDLDDFKKLNDSLGHLAGDRALVHLLAVMQAALRPTDVVARIGGEEFAILFSATGIDDAVAASVRVQQELAARPFIHEGAAQVLSFSAGVTAWRASEGLEIVQQRADEAMYRAKRAGKNRVELSG
jgi:diguanylate cyclase